VAKALAVRVRFPAWSASVRSRHLSIETFRLRNCVLLSDRTASVKCEPHVCCFADSPVVQLRENTRRDSGDVGSIPTGRANFDGPLSLGYR
jgi:hypothetical protein